MARYGTVKYGSGVKYGTAPTTDRLLWTFIVDWDGDGAFSGANEAGRIIDLTITRGRDNFIRNDGTIERYRPGKATVILDNDDGRYNPYNTASPLYPLVRPGRVARLAVKNGSDGDNYALMSGKISDIQPYNRGNRKLVRIDLTDGQEFLSGRTIKIGRQSHAPVSSHRTTGWWVDTILQRAGWPTAWPRTYSGLQDYNNGIYQVMPYGWFWLKDAMEAVRQMETAELGTFLHARDGTARFIERDFVYERLIELDQSQVGRDIAIQQPWETIRNRVEVNVSNYRTKSLDVLNDEEAAIFEIGTDGDGAIEIGGYEAFVTDAKFRYYNYNVVPLSYFTSAIFSDDPDGGSSLEFIVQLSALADGATVIVQNKSATTGYLRLFQFTADAVLYSRSTSVVSDEDSDSQDLYDTRVLVMDSPWIQDNNDAETIAGLLLAALKEPIPYPTVTLEARPDVQFGLDLYTDAVHFTSTTLGIDRLFRIGKIEHQWARENGQAVITTLKFEPDLTGSLPASITTDFSDDFSRDPPPPPLLWAIAAGGNWSHFISEPLPALIWAIEIGSNWSHDQVNGEAVLDFDTYDQEIMTCNIADEAVVIEQNTVVTIRFRFNVGGYELFRVAVTTHDETKTYIASLNSITYSGTGYHTHSAYPGQIYPALLGETIDSIQIEKLDGSSATGTVSVDNVELNHGTPLLEWDFNDEGDIVVYDPLALSDGEAVLDFDTYDQEIMTCNIADEAVVIEQNTVVTIRFRFNVGGYVLFRVAVTTHDETKTYIASLNSTTYSGTGYHTHSAYPGQIYPALLGETIDSIQIEKLDGSSATGTVSVDNVELNHGTPLLEWDFNEAEDLFVYDPEPWSLGGDWVIENATAQIDLTTDLSIMAISLNIEVTAETRVFVMHRWSLGQASDDTAVSLQVTYTGPGGLDEYVIIPITISAEYKPFIHTPPAGQIGNTITAIGLVKWGFYSEVGTFFVDKMEITR